MNIFWAGHASVVLAICAGSFGLVPASAADPGAGDEIAARKLAVRKCAKCHRFYDPSAYPAVVWDQWMDRMSRKSRLNAAQDRQIRAYLASLRRPEAR